MCECAVSAADAATGAGGAWCVVFRVLFDVELSVASNFPHSPANELGTESGNNKRATLWNKHNANDVYEKQSTGADCFGGSFQAHLTMTFTDVSLTISG